MLEQNSKNRSRRDFSRQPKPPQKTTETIMMLMEVTTQNHSTSSLHAAQKSRTTATRHEVYANLDIVCADRPGVHDLKLKVDTGSSGNTLAVRIARQMYGEMWQSKVEPAPNVKLTAYDRGEIECCGVPKILCRYKDCQWLKYKFYVVDVDGPAIRELRACEQMHVVTINAIKSSASCSVPAGTAQKTTATPIEDLKKQFPDLFDRIGRFLKETLASSWNEMRDHRSTHHASAASTPRRDCNRNSTLWRTARDHTED